MYNLYTDRVTSGLAKNLRPGSHRGYVATIYRGHSYIHIAAIQLGPSRSTHVRLYSWSISNWLYRSPFRPYTRPSSLCLLRSMCKARLKLILTVTGSRHLPNLEDLTSGRACVRQCHRQGRFYDGMPCYRETLSVPHCTLNDDVLNRYFILVSAGG